MYMCKSAVPSPAEGLREAQGSRDKANMATEHEVDGAQKQTCRSPHGSLEGGNETIEKQKTTRALLLLMLS